MRPWRKLHSSILESERFMDMGLEAKVLFFLLVAAQDDTGYYPWERMKVRHLVAVCAWTEAQARTYAQDLVEHGMASWEEGGIVLRKGADLNGKPRDDRKGVLYQRSTTITPLTVSDGQVTATGSHQPASPITQIEPQASDIPLTVSDGQVTVLEEEEEEDKRKNAPVGVPTVVQPPALRVQAPLEAKNEKKQETTFPNSCAGWQELIQSVDTQQHQVKTLVDMVTHHFPHPPPKAGDAAAALLKQVRDPPYVVKLLWDAMGANPAGNVFHYAAGIYGKRNGTGQKIDPRRAHERGSSTGRPWENVAASSQDDSGKQAV